MWLIGEYKAMRSPGCNSDCLTLRPIRACSSAECGKPGKPACSKAHLTSPEQSKVMGPSPPHTYDEPCLLSAMRAACTAIPVPAKLIGKWVVPPDTYAALAWRVSSARRLVTT